MIRLVYTAPDPTRNTSWWRGMGPMIDLEQRYPGEFQVSCPTQIGWDDLRRADVLWIMHAGTDDHQRLIEMARGNGCRVIIDWDDLIWEIPAGNYIKSRAPAAELDKTAELICQADMLSVSTQGIADYCSTHGLTTPTRVFPNALCDGLRWTAQPMPSRTVLWRGGQTHDGDIASVQDDVVRLADEFQDWHFVWAGWDRWEMTSRIDRDRWSFWDLMPLAQYHSHLAKLAPSIIMSPLLDSEFNRCKSRLGVYEAAIAGGTLVCPSLPNLANSPGSLQYTAGVEGSGFLDVMRRAMSEPAEFHRLRALAGRDAIDSKERTRHVLPTLRDMLYEVCELCAPA